MNYMKILLNWEKQLKIEEGGTVAKVNNDCDILNNEDINDRITELRSELLALENVVDSYPGERDTWENGSVSLIRDSYFMEYAKTMAESQISTNMDDWPMSCIDWDLALSKLKKGLTPINFNGVRYWV